MKALRIEGKGGPEVLRLQDVPDPQAGAWEVVVRVKAAALNRADLLQCLGMYPAPPGAPKDIPGLEYAGEVEAVGAQVRRFKVGDKVMGIVGGGAFAERLVAHEREVIRLPAGMGFTDAAALPEALLTAYDAVVTQGGLVAGDVVLIHAVASGVGSAAAQLFSALGATVVGTSRSEAKLARARELGVHHGIAVSGDPPKFAEAIRAATAGRGVDVCLDLVSGDYLPETVEAMAPKGRIVLVGMLGGASAELPLGRILQKRLRLYGTVLRSRPLEEKLAAAQLFEHSLLPLIERGLVKPIVDGVFPFTEAAKAFERLSSNASFGKLVLAW